MCIITSWSVVGRGDAPRSCYDSDSCGSTSRCTAMHDQHVKKPARLANLSRRKPPSDTACTAEILMPACIGIYACLLLVRTQVAQGHTICLSESWACRTSPTLPRTWENILMILCGSIDVLPDTVRMLLGSSCARHLRMGYSTYSEA